MTAIAPCITVETLEEYQAAVTRLEPFAERVHIDISDGEFAPRRLLGVEQLYWPSNWQVDIHAMVKRPSQYIQQLFVLRPQTITIHAEAEEDIVPVLNMIKQMGIRAGVALLKPTVPKNIAPAIEASDYVLVFSGNLGHYGGQASLMQLEKVRLIRMIHPSVEVGWDGGASVENVFSLGQGGVDVINVGGAISTAEDPAEVYTKMVTEANKRGVM
jgi:ribulose-phosphate 3-epimerase